MTKAAKRTARDALRGRMGKERFDTLVRELVELHRAAVPMLVASVFGLEGPLRHALRGDLCLQGWKWRDADFAAREIMATVYGRLRVQRPPWAEGQREWTISAGDLIERTRCANCHGKLPPENWKFCSRGCATVYHDRLSDRRHADEERTAALASRWI